MSYHNGQRTYQLGVVPLDIFGDQPGMTFIPRWMSPSQWGLEYTDFTAEAENLGRQWILLNRRGNTVLEPRDKQALQLIADEYNRFLTEEVRVTGSGWFFGGDRRQLDAFKKLYYEWYDRVEARDPALQSYVTSPQITLGPPPEDAGILPSLDEITKKIEDLLKSKYALPALGVGALFLGFIWMTSRSGAKSGVRYHYRR